MRTLRPLVLLLTVASAVAYAGLLFAAGTAARLVWVALLAVGQGGFPLILAAIGLRARTAEGTVALSAFTQSFGYVIAALGPLLVGVLYEATGGWTAPMGVLVVALAVQTVAGLVIARPRYVEDELVGQPAAGGLGGDRLLDRRVGLQHLDQAADLEDAQHAALRGGQADDAAGLVAAVLGADEDRQTGRVAERDVGQVEHQPGVPPVELVGDLVLQLRRGGHVELATDRDHDEVVPLFCPHRQRHAGDATPLSSTGPDERAG